MPGAGAVVERADRWGIIVMSTGTGRALCNVNGGANETFHDIPVEKRNIKGKK
jgi:hypothetical protein